jgi:hypothetical protein
MPNPDLPPNRAECHTRRMHDDLCAALNLPAGTVGTITLPTGYRFTIEATYDQPE